MPAAGNAEVVELLENIADMLEIKGESVFRVRAYRDAARSVDSLTQPLSVVIEQGDLCEIPGIGESIAAKIKEFVDTGHSQYYEELRESISPGVASLLQVPGIGPKKARLFSEQLGIDSVEALENAARNHLLSKIPRIGAKTEQSILDSIERMHGRSDRIPLGVALPKALSILDSVRNFPQVIEADLAGSIRRMMETIGDIDLIASSPDPSAAVEAFVSLPDAKSVLVKGPTKGTIVTPDHLQIDLRVVLPEEYGSGLQHFTGSKAHNIKIRTIAESKGLKVNEYGTFRISDDARVAGDTEESVYNALGLSWMPPELREDRGEIEAAGKGTLPALIQIADLMGDLHIHTDWSDGANTPEEMVLAGIDRGYEYMVISDHSISMGFIHGLNIERIMEQRKLIDMLNDKYPSIRILHGTEMNIRADGSLDYEDSVLEMFDVVTASIHSGMGMSCEKMTDRIIRAIENPHVDVLGHPTGRTLGKREPYEVDMSAVIKAAARTGTALEINSQPSRLDLRDIDARAAKESGVMLVINSDAHAADQLGIVSYGIATARRGWIESKDVLNALPLSELLDWLNYTGVPVRRAA